MVAIERWICLALIVARRPVKTYRNLYPTLIAFPNLLLAYHKARQGKRLRPNVGRFKLHLEAQLWQLHEALATRTYTPGAYRSFYVHDPVRRLVSAAPFRDRVVHHALCNVLEPIYERRFIADSYACRLGKGTHRAIRHFCALGKRKRGRMYFCFIHRRESS